MTNPDGSAAYGSRSTSATVLMRIVLRRTSGRGDDEPLRGSAA